MMRKCAAIPSSTEDMWFFTWMPRAASISMRSLLWSPSSFASVCILTPKESASCYSKGRGDDS